MYNFRIFKNNCKEEIINKIALQKDHAEYILGRSLSATIDVGKKRTHQEDSVMIAEHPKNNKFKLIGVSDGVGGQREGNLASNHVAKKLILWFENLDLEYFYNTKKLKDEMRSMLKTIMEDSTVLYGAATLSAAIVGKDETLIVNIGDSRVYSYKDGVLKQETIDDSDVEEMYYYEEIPAKELMRFHKYSNRIKQAIDIFPNHYNPIFKIIKNADYDRVYAFTDGVTDCLSDKDLESIIRNSEFEATRDIVQQALEHDSNLWKEIDKLPRNERIRIYKIADIIRQDYYQNIPGGKDNTTAAEYRKK